MANGVTPMDSSLNDYNSDSKPTNISELLRKSPGKANIFLYKIDGN